MKRLYGTGQENGDRYISKSQVALCRVMDLLAGEGFPALSQAEIVRDTGLTTDKVFRTLHLLHQRGWVEKHAGERYRLSQYWPKLGYRYGERLVLEREQARQRLQEFRE